VCLLGPARAVEDVSAAVCLTRCRDEVDAERAEYGDLDEHDVGRPLYSTAQVERDLGGALRPGVAPDPVYFVLGELQTFRIGHVTEEPLVVERPQAVLVSGHLASLR